MKLLRVKRLIKESIKKLINEQQGLVPYTNVGGFSNWNNEWVFPTISPTGNGQMVLTCPIGYTFGPVGLTSDPNGTARPFSGPDVVTSTTQYNNVNGVTKLIMTRCRLLDSNSTLTTPNTLPTQAPEEKNMGDRSRIG